MVIPFVRSGMPVVAPTYQFRATAPEITYSDYDQLAFVSGNARMTRPHIDDAVHLNDEMPAGRIRFRTSSPTITLGLLYLNIIAVGPYNLIGIVLVNGVVAQQFSPTASSGNEHIEVPVALGASADRLVEVLLPYGNAMDFVGLSIEPGYTISPAAPRPTKRLAIHGDSITHGYYTTRVDKTYPYLLNAALTDYQVINMGFASHILQGSDGTGLGQMGCDGIVTVIGANSAGGSGAQAEFQALFANIRAIQPTVPIIAVTLFYTTGPGNDTYFETFRQSLRNAVAAMADPNITLVEGPSLIGHTSASFYDGLHLSDQGASEVATNLAPILSSVLP